MFCASLPRGARRAAEPGDLPAGRLLVPFDLLTNCEGRKLPPRATALVPSEWSGNAPGGHSRTSAHRSSPDLCGAPQSQGHTVTGQLPIGYIPHRKKMIY